MAIEKVKPEATRIRCAESFRMKIGEGIAEIFVDVFSLDSNAFSS
jgi:hypothetical protein